MEQKQKAILIGINLNDEMNFTDSMEELANLADACNIEVVGAITQNLNRQNTVTYMGTGKIEEVINLLHKVNAEFVISNDELSPSQIRNLEAEIPCRVIDRTVLILDIFAGRAKTKEAKLQVEIAKLQYTLPRLAGLGESLGRQGGGAFNNRGSGETKLEMDRRKIEDRISALQKELETLVAQRQNQRKLRKKSGVPVVALVGYTNAGKSTIMNEMLALYGSVAEKQVFEKDMLFATLETSVRSIQLTDNKSFLLTDTVGFISKLPHQLIKAFRSTLEEVTEADVLLHIIDYSNSNYKMQIDVTNETLSKLGVEKIPVIYVYNKIDLLNMDAPKSTEDSVYISAKSQDGIDELIKLVRVKAFPNYVSCEMLIPYDKGNIVSYFNDSATIYSTEYKSDGILLSLELKEADFNRFINYKTEIN